VWLLLLGCCGCPLVAVCEVAFEASDSVITNFHIVDRLWKLFPEDTSEVRPEIFLKVITV
jgi:hypothetical protein